MTGRKPKPTALKLVQGNPGRRPLNDAEPKPAGVAVRPRFLKGRAARIWGEYAPELTRLGLLTGVDGHAFAAWCCLAAELEEDPRAMIPARLAQFRALAASFGLEPSARARLSGIGGEPEPEDPAEAYFR